MATQLEIWTTYSNNIQVRDTDSGFGIYPPLATGYWFYVRMTFNLVTELYGWVQESKLDDDPQELQVFLPFMQRRGNSYTSNPLPQSNWEDYNDDDADPDFSGTSGLQILLDFPTQAAAARALTRWNNLTNQKIEFSYIGASNLTIIDTDPNDWITTDLIALFGSPTVTRDDGSDILEFTWAEEEWA